VDAKRDEVRNKVLTEAEIKISRGRKRGRQRSENNADRGRKTRPTEAGKQGPQRPENKADRGRKTCCNVEYMVGGFAETGKNLK
jgi:hypothetical protein